MSCNNNVNVLTLISSCSQTGGTPVKLSCLCRESRFHHYVYFFMNTPDGRTEEHLRRFGSPETVMLDGRSKNRRTIPILKALIRIVDQYNITVVQAFFPFEFCIAASLKIFRPRLKLIYEAENLLYLSFKKRCIMKLALRFADYAVYISNAVMQQKRKEFPILNAIPGEVIYNGAAKRIDMNTFDSHPGRFRLLQIGGLNSSKNPHFLIELMNCLVNKYKIHDIELMMIGQGPEEIPLRQRIADCCLKDYVELYGNTTDIGGALQYCDLYVHPASHEGFGIAVVEAMLAKCNVMLADSGGLSELVENGVSGFLLPIVDVEVWARKIIELRGNPELCKRIASAGQKRAEENFSIKCFVSNHDALYEKLAQGR